MGVFLNRQRSFNEFGRFDNHKESAKENNRSRMIGGSMRFTEKLTLPGKSSSLSKISGILPGRLSVNGSDFYRKNYEPESDSFTDAFDLVVAPPVQAVVLAVFCIDFAVEA
jgi:hypothetical protein